jgi:hypothetical protein
LIKRPTLVRDRILARTVDMLEHLRLQISMWLPDEHDVMLCLNRPQQYDLAEKLASVLFENLGGEASKAKEPRFNKLHRAKRKYVKCLKGENLSLTKAERQAREAPNEHETASV